MLTALSVYRTRIRYGVKSDWKSSFLSFKLPSSSTFSTTASDDLTTMYERKSPIEHILLRPGMYIGQIELSQADTWLLDSNDRKMKKDNLIYSPALLKLFDEIIVNAADNRHRDGKMSKIEVNIERKPINSDEKLVKSVLNDGKGIPVQIHPTEKIYIPE